MKKIVIILIIILVNFKSASAIQYQKDELEILADFMIENEMKIDEWEVIIKEKIGQNKVESLLEEFEVKYEVSSVLNDKVTKYDINNQKSISKIAEEIKLIIPNNKINEAELIVVISGSEWNESIGRKYRDKIKKLSKDYFTEKAYTFTCLSSNNNAIMKDVGTFKYLEESLRLKNVSTQTDNTKNMINKSIYGYTDLWNEEILINDELLNVQMVTKKTTNENLKIILGTPIIINEY